MFYKLCNQKWKDAMVKTKSFSISKALVVEAFKRVKANAGAAGIDDQSIRDFEKNLKDNLYKIWNRMSSGSYFPPPVKAVEIPKGNGGKRVLGIPTVGDRVAQMVVKLYIEPDIDKCFHQDSYGYRPGRSAHQGLEVTRQRCWKYAWVIDLDVKGFFDNMDHDLTMKALRHHVQEKWILMYVERWLKAPIVTKDGKKVERDKGTPQGGVISPLLANLFMHYAFDMWMDQKYPGNPFARYADDAVIHCRTKQEAEEVLSTLQARLGECHLELHPEKTKIVYCKQENRPDDHEHISFDFLSYTFRPRRVRTQKGKVFLGFIPAISGKAKKRIRKVVQEWKLPTRTGMAIEEIARWVNPIVRGWIHYYGKYHRSSLYHLTHYIEYKLSLWACKKYKRLKRNRNNGRKWLRRIRKGQLGPTFAHWAFVP